MRLRREWIGLAVLSVAVSACASGGRMPVEPGPSAAEPTSLPDLGPAPELTNEVWLNSDRPLRLEDLRGKVVVLDFWTFG
jgi:hypothetical protein